MKLITCENLTLGYEGKAILSGLNFTVNSGDYLCIVGENGSGKSTLMKTLLHLQSPMAGTITMGDGLKINEIGYLPQQTALQRDFPASVEEIVMSGFLGRMGLRPFYTKAEKKEARELMEKTRITDLADRCYRELSGGQQQRVLLTRALCATRKILLLDEPVSGLDVVAREQFYRILLEEFTETGRTFVVSTHIMEEAADLFEEVIILKEGKLLLKENTEELLESCLHISGKAEEVDRATEGLEKHYEERLGRSKSVMVRLKPGQELPDAEVTVQPMNLEKVFVALCGEEA